MSTTSHRFASVLVMILVLVAGLLVATMKQSVANQTTPPGVRYEYRILKEHPVGEKLRPSRSRDPFGRLEPPRELQDYLNELGRDGWEVEDLRLRNARSELQANREGPSFYLYSDAGENGPRFLRLRRRIQ